MTATTVSIVTPSYNQGRFLRQAIDSVLDQDCLGQSWPDLDYWVIDGGSTDDSLDILRAYGDRIRWLSEPDRGQSHAINKGFARAKGEILAWLNSDDTYLPGAIERAIQIFAERPEVVLVYGRGEILDAEDRQIGPFTGIEPFNLWRLLHGLDYILQPATFFRRSAIEKLGGVNENLHYCMDWDLWIRLAAIGEVAFLDQPLACSREYGDTKTSTGGWRRIRELGKLAQRHTGTFFTPGVRLYALDTLERQITAHTPRMASRWSPFFRSRMAKIQQKMPVHADGWLGPASWLSVPRRWRRGRVVLEALVVPETPIHVRLVGEGGVDLASLKIAEPGRHPCEFDIPTGIGDFAHIRVDSDFSFVPAQRSQGNIDGDQRRLALICRDLTDADDVLKVR